MKRDFPVIKGFLFFFLLLLIPNMFIPWYSFACMRMAKTLCRPLCRLHSLIHLHFKNTCSAGLDMGLWAHFLLVKIKSLFTKKSTEKLQLKNVYKDIFWLISWRRRYSPVWVKIRSNKQFNYLCICLFIGASKNKQKKKQTTNKQTKTGKADGAPFFKLWNKI